MRCGGPSRAKSSSTGSADFGMRRTELTRKVRSTPAAVRHHDGVPHRQVDQAVERPAALHRVVDVAGHDARTGGRARRRAEAVPARLPDVLGHRHLAAPVHADRDDRGVDPQRRQPDPGGRHAVARIGRRRRWDGDRRREGERRDDGRGGRGGAVAPQPTSNSPARTVGSARRPTVPMVNEVSARSARAAGPRAAPRPARRRRGPAPTRAGPARRGHPTAHHRARRTASCAGSRP